MRSFRIGATIVVAAMCLHSIALAWGNRGHIQVADIAWTRLNSKAKQQIAAILTAGDPLFRPKSTSEADVRAAFRRAATFADVIKSNRGTDYESMIPAMNNLGSGA